MGTTFRSYTNWFRARQRQSARRHRGTACLLDSRSASLRSIIVPLRLSHPLWQSGRIMKTIVNGLNERRYHSLIARFGQARLVARVDGSLELRGASSGTLTEVKEWISLFMHDAVLHIATSN
jgi:hypothetical protein